MLAAFANAFRTPDLRRKKIFFTLAILAFFRLGSIVPTPVTSQRRAGCFQQATTGEQQGLYALINLFSGGALLQLAIFALGIMPYITASIILQLLTVVIPRLEALKKEGQAGQTKITQYTRYLTLVLAVLHRGRHRWPSTGLHRMSRRSVQQGHLPRGGHDLDDDGRHRRHHVAR